MTSAVLTARWPLACFFALGVYAGTWGALIPDIKEQVGATDAELGFALLFAAAGTVPGTLVAGRLWRRFGWWLLPVTAVSCGLTLVGPMLATTPLTLGVALLFTGFTAGMLDVSMNAAVSDTEASRNARLMYGAHALFSLGGLASFPTGIARQFDVGTASILGAVAITYIVVGLGSIGAARIAGRGLHVETTTANDPTAPRFSIIAAGLAGFMVLCAVSFLIEDGINSWSALHLEQTLGSSPALGSAAPGVFALAMFIGRSLGQRLGNRFSDRALLTTGASMAAVGLAFVAAAPTPTVALVFVGVAGGGIALVAPALYARAGRMAHPRNRAAAIARLTSFGYTGFLLGPPLVGALSQLYGLPIAFAVLAMMATGLAIGGWVVLGRGGGRGGSFEEGEELLKTSRG